MSDDLWGIRLWLDFIAAKLLNLAGFNNVGHFPIKSVIKGGMGEKQGAWEKNSHFFREDVLFLE